jgi:hypothetical protein
MNTWQGIFVTIGIVIAALIVYDRFIKGKILT